jgi:ABC-type glycerol-3-phosphate transport system substrate-binding protein
MHRKWIGLAAASVLLVTACGGSTTPAPSASQAANAESQAPAASAPVAVANLNLRYCWGGEGEVKAMEKVISAWNAKNPDIQVTGISGSINTEEVAAAVAGGAPPDMVIMCDNGAVAGFAHDKVIMQLDPLLDSIKADKSNIIPAALKWVTYQGGLYGLPFGQDTWALYYDTDASTEPASPGPEAADDPGRAVGRRREAHEDEP